MKTNDSYLTSNNPFFQNKINRCIQSLGVFSWQFLSRGRSTLWCRFSSTDDVVMSRNWSRQRNQTPRFRINAAHDIEIWRKREEGEDESDRFVAAAPTCQRLDPWHGLIVGCFDCVSAEVVSHRRQKKETNKNQRHQITVPYCQAITQSDFKKWRNHLQRKSFFFSLILIFFRLLLQ